MSHGRAPRRHAAAPLAALRRLRVVPAVMLAVMLAGMGAGIAPAGAQEADAADAGAQGAADADVTATPARVTLAAVDPVAPAGGAVRFAVVIEHLGADATPWTDVEVIAELHAALGSRSALRAALDGGAVPRRVQRAVVPAPPSPPLRPGGVLRISGELPLTTRELARADTSVHALRLRVRADGVEVGMLDTAVVRLGAAPSTTLATTLVWPLTAPPARDPEGGTAAALDPLTVPGGRLDTLVAALEPTPTVAAGVALSVPAHLLEDLEQRAATVPDGVDPAALPDDVDPAAVRAATLLQRLRTTALTLPAAPLATPYAHADVARVLASGPTVQPLAGRALVEGGMRLTALLGRSAAPITLLDAPATPAMLDLVPTRTVIVPHTAIDAPDLVLDVPLGEPARTLRSPTGRPMTALVGDPFLTIALGASTRADPGDPVRAAQEVLVRTAMVHLEAPGREGRSLVLLPPTGFDPDPTFAAEVLARLGAAAWLTPVAPEGIVAATVGARPSARLADVRVAPLSDRLRGALTLTSRDLELLVGAVDLDPAIGDPAIPIGGRALRDASDELLRATSRRLDVDDALALLAGVRDGVSTAFGTSSIAIDDVTLTDRDGTVPLTVAHGGPVPLRVRVEMVGPAALTWTEGRVRELVLDGVGEDGPDGDPAVQSLAVPVRSGATGRFPVTVRVTDPSGERVLATATIGVRATALATPALAVIGAVVLLLTAIGAVRQRRRGLAWPPRTAAGTASAGTTAPETTAPETTG